MRWHGSRTAGFLAMDAVFAIGLTMVLYAAIATAYLQFSSAGRMCDFQRQLWLVAEDEMIGLRAAGISAEVQSPPARHTSDGAIVAVRTRVGAGRWEGMMLVTVTVRQRFRTNWQQAELTAYIVPTEGRP